MKRTAAVVLAGAALLVLSAGPTIAGTCIAGGCHKGVTAMKFLHGPVAAEDAGGEGCVSCHVPAGAACTSSKAGQFAFKAKEDRLCLLCHDRGTATQHTRTRSDCLSCHSPHGSDQSMILLRPGRKDPSKKKP